MPTSTPRHLIESRMPLQQYAYPPTYRRDSPLISPSSIEADGGQVFGLTNGQVASRAYPASNRALGFMFSIVDYFLVQKVWWGNGTTASTNNADVGVYTEDGATLLVSGGSTLIATANVVQEVDCTDTLLAPGRYWCVYNQNGTTATPLGYSAVLAGIGRCMGWAQFAGAVPLGSAFTPAALASPIFPFFGIAKRTQVA